MLGKEIAFVIAAFAVQFSRGKEIREKEYYYVTMAVLIMIGKKLGQSSSRKSWSSTKCKALFSLEQGWAIIIWLGSHFEEAAFSRGPNHSTNSYCDCDMYEEISDFSSMFSQASVNAVTGHMWPAGR